MILRYYFPILKEGHCSIDSPARSSITKMGDELLISGWAYNPSNMKIPDLMTMYFINEDTQEIYSTAIKRGEKREDVAQALGNPSLINSGFRGAIERSQLPPGKYQLVLLQIDPHAGVISCAGEIHRVTLE